MLREECSGQTIANAFLSTRKVVSTALMVSNEEMEKAVFGSQTLLYYEDGE